MQGDALTSSRTRPVAPVAFQASPHQLHPSTRTLRATSSNVDSAKQYVSPRSPRSPLAMHVATRPARDRLAQESLKKRGDATSERQYVQHQMEGRAPVVETTRRSHRRANSLNVRPVDRSSSDPSYHQQQQHLQQLHLQKVQRGQQSLADKRRGPMGQRGGAQHAFIPAGHSTSAVSLVGGKEKSHARFVARNEQMGHRRANSWDPRNVKPAPTTPRSKVDLSTLSTLEQVAFMKAELKEKERLLLEKQSRQEAEYKSLAEEAAIEMEVEELLRLQRGMPVVPGLQQQQDPVLQYEEYTDEEDERFHEELQGQDLEHTLQGLNQQLEVLKQQALRIENRVKELRCPGPTPLEMLTGMSLSHIPGPSTLHDVPFSSSLPSNARKVEARRSPGPTSGGRTKSQSPDQSKAYHGFSVSPTSPTSSSFSSAFSSFRPI